MTITPDPREWQIRSLSKALLGFANLEELRADTDVNHVTGSLVQTLDGHTYQVVEAEDPDYHVESAGGVRFRVVGEEASIFAFGATATGAEPVPTDDCAPFRLAAASGIRRIRVPKGVYYLDNLVADDTDFSRCAVVGDTLFDCEPGTVIRFTGMQHPLFTFANSTGGGVRNATFRFAGDFLTTDPSAGFEYDFMGHCDVARTGRGAGPNVMRQVILVMDSDRYIFENLTFESEAPGQFAHMMNGCIFTAGHGHKVRAQGGVVRNMRFFDCIMGHIAIEQEHFDFGPYVSARRGGYDLPGAGYAPGHVLYLSGWQPDWSLTEPARSASYDFTIRNGVVRDVFDWGDPITANDGICMAPMAIKGCHNIDFGRVTSYHPEGLVQSFQSVRHCSFAPMVWRYTGTELTAGRVLSMADGDFHDNEFDEIVLHAPDQVFSFELGEEPDEHLCRRNRFRMIRVTSPGNWPGSYGALMLSRLSASEVTMEWEPTSPAEGAGSYVFPINDLTGAGDNRYNIRLIGPNVTYWSRRVIAKGSEVTIDNTALEGASTDLPYAGASSRTIRAAGSTLLCPAAGSTAFSYQLAGQGLYAVDITIWNSVRGEFTKRSFEVVFSPDFRGIADVQEVGTPIENGTELTGLSLTVTPEGLLEAAFGNATGTSLRALITWTRKSSLLEG